MATQAFKSLMSRLSSAGFKKPFVHAALLPDWWDMIARRTPTCYLTLRFGWPDSYIALLRKLETRVSPSAPLPRPQGRD